MNTGKTFWGVFLLAIGILFLLPGVVPLSLDWTMLWRLWPLALVLAGVGLLLRKHPARIVVVVITALFLALVVYGFFSFLGPYESRGAGRAFTDRVVVPYEAAVTRASLSLELGAGRCFVEGGTDELLEASGASTFGRYLLDQATEGDTETLALRFSAGERPWRFWRADNTLDVRLNPVPLWSITLECGAAKAELDLSGCKVEDLKVEAGASTVKVRLGALVPETHIRIEAGVSSVRLEVPEAAGCEVRIDAPLTSKRFSGFRKQKSGLYRTDNFETAEKKIFVEVEAGVSSVRVGRYPH